MHQDKKELFRGLITKICSEKKYPEIKYEKWFIGEYDNLLLKLRERKNDLPSVNFLEQKYKFDPFDTDLTTTDIIELLNGEYAEQAARKTFTEMTTSLRGDKAAIDFVQMLDKIKDEMVKARGIISLTNTTSLEEDVDQLVDDYEAYQELKDAIHTGFDKMDAEAPLRRGDVVFLIGGTGGGKSLTAQRWAAQNIIDKIPATMISLEMNRLQVWMRLMPMVTEGKVKHSDLKRGKVSKADFKKALQDMKSTFNLVTRMNPAPIKISTIEAHLEACKSKGLDKVPHILYLDYIGLLDQDKNWNAEESISGQLKRLATAFNVCIVVLVQADTPTLQSGAMPKITSAADNKGIVRDGDTVIGLLSEKQQNGKESFLALNYQILKRRDDGGYIDFSYKVSVEKGSWVDSCGGSANA